MKNIEIGYIDVPIVYNEYTQEQKDALCDAIIDEMLKNINHLFEESPEVDRVSFLMGVLESTIEQNETAENYEVCQVITDCKRRIIET